MNQLSERLALLNTAIDNLATGQAVFRLKTADKEITYQQSDLAQLRKERDQVASALTAQRTGIVYLSRSASRD